jgi:hypothetical protein
MAKEEEKPNPVADSLAEASKADLESVLVIGMTKEGQLVMQSSVNHVSWMHWAINKALFDLILFERNQAEAKAKEEASKETDAES